MKNRKLFLILIIMFLMPISAFAEVCKQDDIKIEEIELKDIKGNAEETSSSNSDNNTINLNAKMNVIGDSLTYKIVIKNTSNNDYVFDKTQITKDYVNYDISYEDDSNIIKAGEEKIIYLRLNYESKPQTENLTNGVFTSNNQVSFQLINESGTAMDLITNPETRNKAVIILIIVITSISLVIALGKRQKKFLIIMFVISIFIIPKMVKAMCTCTLDVNLNLEIDAKEAIFLPGGDINSKIIELATDRYNITSIKKSEIEPTNNNKEEKNIVSTTDSPYPIYMWYENGTIYWWSEDKTPSLNENARRMFGFLYNLNDISGIETFDSANTKDLGYFLCSASVEKITELTNWNTSKIELLDYTFSTLRSLVNLSGLENWDTSNVTNMYSLFGRGESLNNIDAIKNWDVSNVKNMQNIFQMLFSIEEIDLSNWETKSLENMNGMFSMAYRSDGTTGGIIKRIILSEKFDTSNVTDMSWSFYNNQMIEDYSFLEYLDTSKVEAFYGTFVANNNLRNLENIRNWDVSNVTDFRATFSDCRNLTDMSAINNWNIKKDADFTDMLFAVPSRPTFAKVEGTWNNRGTFTPTE